MSLGQTGHTPRGVPPKFFMFIGFFLSPNNSWQLIQVKNYLFKLENNYLGHSCGSDSTKEPVEEPSYRSPKVLQNLGSQAQLFRACNSSPVFGSGDRPVAWGSSTRRGGVEKFVPSLDEGRVSPPFESQGKLSVEPKVRLQGYCFNPFCSHSSRCLAVLV